MSKNESTVVPWREKQEVSHLTIPLLQAKVDELLSYCVDHPEDEQTAKKASMYAHILLHRTRNQ